MAQGMFPQNHEKGEENIRTTTKKHASIILDRRTNSDLSMAGLWAYARLEEILERQEQQ